MLVVFPKIRITLHEILLLLENIIVIKKKRYSACYYSLLVYHFPTNECFYCESLGWNKPIYIKSYIEELILSMTNEAKQIISWSAIQTARIETCVMYAYRQNVRHIFHCKAAETYVVQVHQSVRH